MEAVGATVWKLLLNPRLVHAEGGRVLADGLGKAKRWPGEAQMWATPGARHMACVGAHEEYRESRLRERRLARFKHWEEIQVRLRHRWLPDRVIRWHQGQWPSEPCPPKTTLFRYVKSKPPGWFVSKLVLAESGTRTVHRQLVAERQAELIETMIMRLQVALKFEKEMNGILVPEVTRNFELLDRILMDHFRVLRELGVELKMGSMAPAAPRAERGGAGVERVGRLVERIVELPKEEFLPLLHEIFSKQRARAPLLEGPIIGGRARRVEPENGKAAG